MWGVLCDGNRKITRSVDKVVISEILTSVLSLLRTFFSQLPNWQLPSVRCGTGNRQWMMPLSISVVLGNFVLL